MRELNVSEIQRTVSRLCVSANMYLPDGLFEVIDGCRARESVQLCKDLLSDILENTRAAKQLGVPICQDTGMAVVFLEIGQDVHLAGGDLRGAVNAGVAQGYESGGLRMSVVSDPLFGRANTNNNTPAVLHTEIVPGDGVKITVAPKGFGSENMSAVRMFTPSAEERDIVSFVAETVKKAGGNPCPPVTVGVGIGGDFEYAAILAKKALCRDHRVPNSDANYARLEQLLLDEINRTGVGTAGFGGGAAKITALFVNIEQYPTHIAGLPVAVNMGCHVLRHASDVI